MAMMQIKLGLSACFLACFAGFALGQEPVFQGVAHLDFGAGNDNPALEIAFGALPGDPEQLVAFSLYNASPGNNVLAAHVLDFPYDGSSFTFFDNIASGEIFGLGNGCYLEDNEDNEGDAVFFPFIQLTSGGDGELRIATFNGSNWSVLAQSGPPTNSFDTADCFNVGQTPVLVGHDTQQNRVVVQEGASFNGDDPFFDIGFCVGGASSCIAGDDLTTEDDIGGPSEGFMRDRVRAWTIYDPTLGATRNPWLVTGQNPAGDLMGLVLTVNPMDITDVNLDGQCAELQIFDPDGFPVPNETALVAAGLQAAAKIEAADINKGIWIWAGSRHEPTELERTIARVRAEQSGDCQIQFESLGTAPLGALGFEGTSVFPFISGGTALLFDEYFETDDNLQVRNTISSYPGNQAGGGPRAGCRLRIDSSLNTRDVFVGAGAHSDGGLNLFQASGETILRGGYENPLSQAVPAITDTEAFATCP